VKDFIGLPFFLPLLSVLLQETLSQRNLTLVFLISALIFAGLIVSVTVAHLKFKLNAVLSFWIAYILTRPLGASIGDYLSQAKGDED